MRTFPEPTAWNGDPQAGDDPNRSGRGIKYRCLDCAWTGPTGAQAYDHHVANGQHHRIAIKYHPTARAAFGCCPTCPTCGEPLRTATARTGCSGCTPIDREAALKMGDVDEPDRCRICGTVDCIHQYEEH